MPRAAPAPAPAPASAATFVDSEDAADAALLLPVPAAVALSQPQVPAGQAAADAADAGRASDTPGTAGGDAAAASAALSPSPSAATARLPPASHPLARALAAATAAARKHPQPQRQGSAVTAKPKQSGQRSLPTMLQPPTTRKNQEPQQPPQPSAAGASDPHAPAIPPELPAVPPAFAATPDGEPSEPADGRRSQRGAAVTARARLAQTLSAPALLVKPTDAPSSSSSAPPSRPPRPARAAKAAAAPQPDLDSGDPASASSKPRLSLRLFVKPQPPEPSEQADATTANPGDTPQPADSTAISHPAQTEPDLADALGASDDDKRARKLLEERLRLRQQIHDSQRVTLEFSKGKTAHPFFALGKSKAAVAASSDAMQVAAQSTPATDASAQAPTAMAVEAPQEQNPQGSDAVAPQAAPTTAAPDAPWPGRDLAHVGLVRKEAQVVQPRFFIRAVSPVQTPSLSDFFAAQRQAAHRRTADSQADSRDALILAPDASRPQANQTRRECIDELRRTHAQDLAVGAMRRLVRLAYKADAADAAPGESTADPQADVEAWAQKHHRHDDSESDVFDYGQDYDDGDAFMPDAPRTDGEHADPQEEDDGRFSDASTDTDDAVDAIDESPITAPFCVVVGPTGCGKSALVHAAAASAGFRVVEVNASQRRTGKDVLAVLGEAALSHGVRSQASIGGATGPGLSSVESVAALPQPPPAAKAGKAGKVSASDAMRALFGGSKRAQANAQPVHDAASDTDAHLDIEGVEGNTGDKSDAMDVDRPAVAPPTDAGQAAPTAVPAATAKAPATRTLLVVEDADVVLDDDRGFWASIGSLAETTRAPIVLTCTGGRRRRVELHA
nr:hypothetical protein HK105_005393 [Polyrhizophydium stewartii]